MSDNVNNGERIAVRFADFEGEAGFVNAGESASIAYFPNRRDGVAPGAGAIVKIDGCNWRVMRREESPYVAGMVVLTLLAEHVA